MYRHSSITCATADNHIQHEPLTDYTWIASTFLDGSADYRRPQLSQYPRIAIRHTEFAPRILRSGLEARYTDEPHPTTPLPSSPSSPDSSEDARRGRRHRPGRTSRQKPPAKAAGARRTGASRSIGIRARAGLPAGDHSSRRWDREGRAAHGAQARRTRAPGCARTCRMGRFEGQRGRPVRR